MLRARGVPAVLLLGAVTGCTTMQPVLAPAPFIAQKQPQVVYVQYQDGSILPIGLPKIQGDSVVGLLLPAASEHVAVALPDARQILARQRDGKRTRWLFAGLAVASGTLVYLVTHSGSSGCFPKGPEEKPTPDVAC